MIRPYRVVTFAALALLVGSGAASGQGPGATRGPGFPLAALDLTEGQREQVRQLQQQHREQTRTLIERLRAAQTARRRAMEVLPVDEGRIRAAMQELAAIEADLAVARARLHSELFALLTPEQQSQAQKLRAERESRINERQTRMQRRQQMRPPRP